MARSARLLTYHDVCIPDLPYALDGFRIAHLTDLHIVRQRKRYRRLIRTLAPMTLDLVVITGDCMTGRKPSPAVQPVFQEILAAINAKYGIYGVFGNHDALGFREMADQFEVRWLENHAERIGDLPLAVAGGSTDRHYATDSVAIARAVQTALGEPRHISRGEREIRLLLMHMPTFLPTAADLGFDVMFAGHTHGGQIRLPPRRALTNSTDLPMELSAGLLRHRDTQCIISRGLGEVMLPLRVCCPPQLPLLTLRRGPRPGQYTEHLRNVMPW